ncbi:MAG: zinc ABC transporter substrate-binding protein [Nitriliruptor sp.]
MRSLPRRTLTLRTAVAGLGLALLASACGSDADAGDVEAATEAGAGADVDPVSVIATTSILGDVVSQLVGDDGEVTVLMGPGVDPHAYAPSARDGALLREADLVVANGLQLEESLVSTLEATEEAGVPVFELAPVVDPLAYELAGTHEGEDEGDAGDHAHEGEGEDDHAPEGEDDHAHEDENDHADEAEGGDDHAHEGEGEDDHADEGEGDHDDHEHGPEDPHVWFDPERMATGVELLAAELAEVAPQIDAAEWEARGARYAAEIREVDDELTEAFAAVPDDRRVIVTNHDALGYLAARYDLDVVGTVIPGSSTQAEADPRGFSQLIETVEEEGIDVIFAENTDSTRLAEQLASEVVGRSDLEVEVVTVATDALGEPGSPTDSYLGLLRETGTTIATHLAATD